MLYADGSQQYFYIAEQINDINEKIYFVHDFVRGYPLEILKVDKLQSSAAQSEDDRGKQCMSESKRRFVLMIVTLLRVF